MQQQFSSPNKNKVREFDFARNDKLYELLIPNYRHVKDLVYYDVHLRDLVNNENYIHSFRFNELKEFHELLQDMKLDLPQFPKTHFWRKTNKNPELIQERKVLLEKYFNVLINDPFTRGSKYMKKFIKMCKYGDKYNSRTYSVRKFTDSSTISRASSMKKINSAVKINVRDWVQ